MKKKKEETKKLVLNKMSIDQLDNDNMNQVKGGTRCTEPGTVSQQGATCHCSPG